ncbi:MAG: OB-fold domain-containing protein [Candidatus Binatus sp.]
MSAGRGRVHSWTITHQPLLRDFPEPVPYAIIIVEMDEGVRIVSGLRGLELRALELELPVEVVFETVGEGTRVPFFGPRSKESRSA